MTIETAPLLGSCRLNIAVALMLGSFCTILMSSSLSFVIVCMNQSPAPNYHNNSNNETNCTQEENQLCAPPVGTPRAEPLGRNPTQPMMIFFFIFDNRAVDCGAKTSRASSWAEASTEWWPVRSWSDTSPTSTASVSFICSSAPPLSAWPASYHRWSSSTWATITSSPCGS